MITGSIELTTQAVKIAPELEAVQSLMPISKEDKAKLKESIKKHGVKDALRGYYKGTQFYLLSGLNRLEIAKEIGIPLLPVEILELKPKDRQAYAIDENLARRQLTAKQKSVLIDYMLVQNPQLSSRQIAKKIGVHHTTVETNRKKTGGEFSHLKRQGADGKSYKRPTKQTEALGRIHSPTAREAPKNASMRLKTALEVTIREYEKDLSKAEIRKVLDSCRQNLLG